MNKKVYKKRPMLLPFGTCCIDLSCELLNGGGTFGKKIFFERAFDFAWSLLNLNRFFIFGHEINLSFSEKNLNLTINIIN